jgi:hypothetical protein
MTLWAAFGRLSRARVAKISGMRYRLRTLLILLAVAPPALAWGWAVRHNLLEAGVTIGVLSMVAVMCGIILAAVLCAFGFR